MSIRREASAPALGPGAGKATPTGALVPMLAPQTTSERMGIQQDVPPPKRPEPFAPQFREVPVVSGTVVDDVFEELDIDVDATGLFGKGKKDKAAAAAKVDGDAPKKGGLMANLKAAKGKADAAVRKASAGAKAAAAGAKAAAASVADKHAGMQKFDYQIYNDDFTAVLAVAKKTSGGTEADAKNNIKAFKKFKHKAVTKQAEAQEAQMMHNETLVKKIKGKDAELKKVLNQNLKLQKDFEKLQYNFDVMKAAQAQAAAASTTPSAAPVATQNGTESQAEKMMQMMKGMR